MKVFVSMMVAMMALAPKAMAQHEMDYAECFMKSYGMKHGLTCNTVSPAMMKRISIRTKTDTACALSKKEIDFVENIKSLRIVEVADSENVAQHQREAIRLLEANVNRYQEIATNKDQLVFGRKKGKLYVEVVMLMNKPLFKVIDLTGKFPAALFEGTKKKGQHKNENEQPDSMGQNSTYKEDAQHSTTSQCR